MSEVIVTLILVGFVVGGGVFIFWPDLLSALTKRTKEKKKTKQTETADSIYRKHYSETEEFIEAAAYAEKYNISLEDAERNIRNRGERIRGFIKGTSSKSACSICGGEIVLGLHTKEFIIRCTCNNRQFKEKASAMFEEAGYNRF